MVVSTVHAAKGLEWPYVFVLGATDKEFPHRRATSESEIEEEKRLLYVAASRAKGG